MAQPIIDPKEIVEHILTTVNYKGDKNAFTAKYLALCEQNTLLALLEGLSEEDKSSLQQKLDANTTQEEKQELLRSYFSEDQITDASYKVTKESFGELLQKLLPVLDENQKNELKQYFESTAKSIQDQTV